MMTYCLGGGTKWGKHCFFEFLKMFVHMIRISYKSEKWDAFGNIGLNSIQKCIVALHILVYGVTPNVVDENYWMGEISIVMEAMKCFVKVVKENFETKYFEVAYMRWYWKVVQNQWRSGVPRYVCKFGFLCNINGKVTWLLGKGNFKIKMAKDQSFLKLL